MRVVLAEDLYLLRTGLERLLTAHGFDVIEAVDNGPALLCALVDHKPDVAVVEIDTEVSGFHKAPPAVFVDTEKVIRTRLQQVMVKSGSDWAIASAHDVDAKTPPETLVNPEDPARARRRR